MIVKEKGAYRLLKDISLRGSGSICIIEKGTILNITRVDYEYHKVIGTELPSWTNWNLPVELVDTDDKDWKMVQLLNDMEKNASKLNEVSDIIEEISLKQDSLTEEQKEKLKEYSQYKDWIQSYCDLLNSL